MNNTQECTNEDCLVCHLVETFHELIEVNSLDDALRHVIEIALSIEEDDESTEELIEEVYGDAYKEGFLDGITESKGLLQGFHDSTIRSLIDE